ncbi:Serine phosphatase RsbU, regulator of sigma subunit [hydrothermal vent metagenome]|uniref:Serine phosphatase RsbU, regulator of sigma subunit n=1 Tax=hydrothermal vent metagenome TaxID=652676 RepID=A0A3B1DTY8_9ZZZZ
MPGVAVVPDLQPYHAPMHRLEITNQSDLTVLTALLRDVSAVGDPVSLLHRFGQHFWKIRPVDFLVSASCRGLGPGEYKITRALPTGRIIEAKERPNPWRDWDTIPAHTGGFLGEVFAQPMPQVLHKLEVRNDPALGDLIAEMGSCMASPIYDHGEALNWNLYFHRDPEFYTADHLADHFLTVNLVGTATRNLIAVNRADELNAKLTAQLEAVARVQQALLPREIPKIPGLKIATSYLTSDEAGGDYYDFFQLPEGRWGVLIADVAGHGAAAATVMAMLHAILHGYEGPEFSPDAVLRYANSRLSASRIDSTFVTAFFGVYTPTTGRFEYARAGHNPPRLKTGETGRVRALDDAAGLPLGITDDYDIQLGSIELGLHDTLVLYTDGITEAFDAKREQFGLDRFDAALVGCSGEPECVVDAVHKAVHAHTKSLGRDDDQTIVAIRRVGHG